MVFLMFAGGIEVENWCEMGNNLASKKKVDQYWKALGEGNLIFCGANSRENFFGSLGRQINNSNPKFQGRHI